MKGGRGQELYRRARSRIPGGTQLLSKRPEMFLPGGWPAYYDRASGVEVWDLDGRKYVDMTHCGVGACVLGYGDPDVDAAVRGAIERGSMTTLNCPEEVELADLLCEIHPCGEMVRLARTGGESMTIAVRIARAHTGRDRIAFCGYHGWHDWYLSANLAEEKNLDGHLLPGLDAAGVPRSLRGTALPFRYNRLDELEDIVSRHGDELAAVVMEPMRGSPPEEGFLEGVRSTARRVGAVLVFDEITSGWRVNSGGIHLELGVEPDLAVFAKAMGNGYPIAAVVGRADVMDAAQDTFISSTYWTERIGPTAALATVRKHRERSVGEHLCAIGAAVREGWTRAGASAALPVSVTGIDPLLHLSFEGDDGSIRTGFVRLMLERGFLAATSFYPTYAHRDEHVAAYLAAVGEVFPVLAEAVAAGTTDAFATAGKAHSGFRRLT